MATNVKCYAAAEAACDTVLAILDKALSLPAAGTHVGGGIHVNMPPTWDGTGATPPGWTKHATIEGVAAAIDAVVQLPDSLATVAQLRAVQARLSAGEISTLSAAITARLVKDCDVTVYPPKP